MNNANDSSDQKNNQTDVNDLNDLKDNTKEEPVEKKPEEAQATSTPPSKPVDKDDFFDKPAVNDEPMFIAEKKEEPKKEEAKAEPEDKPQEKPEKSPEEPEPAPAPQPINSEETKPLPPLNETQLSEEPDAKVPVHDNSAPVTPQPIQKIHTPITPVIVVALVVAFLGFGGGFAAYRYLPTFNKQATTTADTSPSTETNIQPPKSKKVLPSDVTQWPIYTNTKYSYSVSYPDTWYSQNTNLPATDAVRFMNYNPEEKDEGSQIEIVVQNSNDQDLKTWIETNKTVSNTNSTAALSTVKVGTREAYQEKDGFEVKTYLLQNGKVVTISLTSTATEITDSQALYQKVLDSLKLS